MLRRLALLVATYRYEDAGLRRLTAPGHDAEALARVLRDPEIAGFDVTILVNEPRQVVGRAIGEFYRNRRRDDLTLLYFTGHGVKGEDGRLYLAMTDTERDSLLCTALSADQINDAMDSCSSRQKVLVLDCCYSGAFPASRISKADPEVHTLDRFQGKGRVVLTASDSTQYSFEENEISGDGTRSVFTRFLIEGLATGNADLDSDGDITLDELYSYVHDRVVEEMPQQRPKKQENVEGRVVIARNIHWSLPAYLRHAMDSPIARDRLAVLDGLAHLHRIGNDLVRTVVVDHVRRLIDDDSKAVSAVAAKLITTLSTEEAQRELKELARQEAEGREAVEKQVLSSTPTPPMHDTAATNNRSAGDGTVAQIQHPQPTRTAPTWAWRSHRAILASSAALLIVVAVVAVVALIQWAPSPQASTTPDMPSTTPDMPSITPAVPDVPGRVLPRIEVGVQPFGVVVSPNSSHAYITNADSDTVSVIDIASDTVIEVIPLDDHPGGVAVAPDSARTYVTNIDSGTVSVVDVSRAVINFIHVGDGPRGVAVTLDGRRVYVANYDSDDVSVIEISGE